MAAPGKYGLFLPKKVPKPVPRPSVFGDDSDDEHDKGSIEATIRKESMRNLNKMQTQLQMQKAMEEDPTVFEYDEVYDDLKQVREEKKTKVAKDRTPRYITSLLKAAEKRKKENDRRTQHKIQKEREQEGEQFADKEAYVTSAYRKKMQEMQEEEEKEMQRDQLDEMMSVTKQQDLSGFYRHLLRQTVGEEKVPDGTGDLATVTVKVEGDEDKQDEPTKQISTPERPSSSEADDSSKPRFRQTGQGRDQKRYRRRNASEASDETTSLSTSRKDVEKNVDADSDFSVDSDSDDNVESAKELQNEGKEKKRSISTEKESEEETEPPKKTARQTDVEWIAMFEKRTTGEAFEAARARYLERKAARRAAGLP